MAMHMKDVTQCTWRTWKTHGHVSEDGGMERIVQYSTVDKDKDKDKGYGDGDVSKCLATCLALFLLSLRGIGLGLGLGPLGSKEAPAGREKGNQTCETGRRETG